MQKLVTILLSVLSFAAVAQENYTINIKVANVNPSAKAYLNYMVNQKIHQDSAVLIGNQFVFKGTQDHKMKAIVSLSHTGQPVKDLSTSDQVAVYLENGIINVNANDSLVYAKVGGTQLNEDQQQLIDLLNPFKKKRIEMLIDYDSAEGNKARQDKIKSDYATLEQLKKEATESFISSHLNSLVSLNLLLTAVDPANDVAKATKLFNGLSPEVQNSKNGKTYQSVIEEATAISVGGFAPDFTAKNPAGKDISLKSFRGKYVLVDFWASWCGPCRKENPNLVASFNQFKDKNFTILGVSLDGKSGRKLWMDAIDKDGLLWEQVSELKGWQSPVAQLYKVSAIPANLLIDPTGKIIARDISGEDLNKKLKALFL